MAGLIGDFCSEDLGKREVRRITSPQKKSRKKALEGRSMDLRKID
jgi:hypothetical protein